MRLKLITTIFISAVVVLFLAAPVILGPKPSKSAPRVVKRDYGVRVLDYLGGMIFAFAGSGVGSFLIMRRAREEYRTESLNNLKKLMEGAAADAKKANDAPQSE